jgi:hypothetical protein
MLEALLEDAGGDDCLSLNAWFFGLGLEPLRLCHSLLPRLRSKNPCQFEHKLHGLHILLEYFLLQEFGCPRWQWHLLEFGSVLGFKLFNDLGKVWIHVR